MKKQNPQDILSEILLRMNYDSKKTLSENIMSLTEQGSYGYGSNVGSWMDATVKQGGGNDPYEYKKEAGTYYYRKKGSTGNWIATTGPQANSIATKIFGDRAPFAVTNPTTNQVDQNTYPGPRKTTLSSYSSGDDGQDSDLINISQYPQYKYKETDKNRQLQSNYYYKLKNESYQKIIELLRDANTTSNSLQKAWNDFMFNYKMLYRDKDQWDDYKTLLKLINSSKKFKISGGKVQDVAQQKTQLPPISNFIKNKTQKELDALKQKILNTLIGTPKPKKPEKPRQLEKDEIKRCPDILTAQNSVGWFYKYDTEGKVPPNTSVVNDEKLVMNKFPSAKFCWTLRERDTMYEQYYADSKYYELWLEANPDALSNAMKSAVELAKKEIESRDKYRDDVAQQRDAFAIYRNENNEKLYDAVILGKLRKSGVMLEEAFNSGDDDLLMTAWLGFREVWNYWGTQLFTIALTIAPETLGLSTVAAFILDIGVDAFVFIVDLCIAWSKPDDEKAWERLVEDATTLVLYGAISGLGLIIRKIVAAKNAKTLNQAISETAEDIAPELEKSIKQVSDDLDKSPSIPKRVKDWIKGKLQKLLQFVESLIGKALPAKVVPLFSRAIPMVASFMIVLKLAETPLAKVLEPLIVNLIGIPIQRLHEIAAGEIPTDEEKIVLEKVVINPEIEKQYTQVEKQEHIEGVKKTFSDKIQDLRVKTKELYKTDQSGTLQIIIDSMVGDCKDYFQKLKDKGLIQVFLEVKDEGAILSYTNKPVVTKQQRTVYSISGNYGFIKRYKPISSGEASEIEDKDGNAIDCKKLNSELA